MTCLDAFYGGAAGGGKSDALLMAALQYVDIPGYNALLLRDTYANLIKPEGLLDRANEWLSPTDAKWKGDNKSWVFPSGATISFGYLDGPRDHFNYQGAAYQFVGIDEAVGVRENQAIYLFSRMRKKNPESFKKDLKNLSSWSDEKIDLFYRQYQAIPMRFRAASNPPRHEQLARGAWVKPRYVDPETRGDRVYIPAKIDDNPHLNAGEYRRSLAELDGITRKQLEDGDWDVQISGRFFKREWFELVQKLPAHETLINSVRYWDLAATEEDPTKDPAYTAGVRMWEAVDGLCYIDSVIRKRMSPRNVEQLVRQTADMDTRNMAICMEQEPGSAGVNNIYHYQNHILREFAFYGIKKQGNKIDEARPLSAKAEAGLIKLVNGPWVKDFLDEIELFPDGKFKDQVDATSGAYNWLAAAPKVGARWL